MNLLEKRLTFLKEVKTSENLTVLCESLGISRTTAYNWMEICKDGIMCVSCKRRPFTYFKAKLCEPCKEFLLKNEPQKVISLRQNKPNNIAYRGYLSKDEIRNIEAIMVVGYLEKGYSPKEILKIFKKDNYYFVTSRLRVLGKSVDEYKSLYKHKLKKRGRKSLPPTKDDTDRDDKIKYWKTEYEFRNMWLTINHLRKRIDKLEKEKEKLKKKTRTIKGKRNLKRI